MTVDFTPALKGTLETTPESAGIIATPAEAIAGIRNDRIMTPLRVQQYTSNLTFNFAPFNQAVPLTNNGTGWFLGKGSTTNDDFQWQQIITGGTVETISIATANGFAGTSDGDPSNPELTLSTTVTGLVKGNGTTLSAATAGTDYLSPAAIGTTVQAYSANLDGWATVSESDYTPTSGFGTAAFDDASDFATAAQGALADSAVQSVVAGANISVDSTDPQNPVISATGGGAPSVNSQASASSITPDVDTYSVYALTALAANLTINAPTGTPVDAQQLAIRIKDNSTVRTLTWNAAFTAPAAGQLPSVTVDDTVMYLFFWWNASSSKWELVGGNPLAGLWGA
jgi:hypothetical protein